MRKRPRTLHLIDKHLTMQEYDVVLKIALKRLGDAHRA
jgi:hypothetical protein